MWFCMCLLDLTCCKAKLGTENGGERMLNWAPNFIWTRIICVLLYYTCSSSKFEWDLNKGRWKRDAKYHNPTHLLICYILNLSNCLKVKVVYSVVNHSITTDGILKKIGIAFTSAIFTNIRIFLNIWKITDQRFLFAAYYRQQKCLFLVVSTWQLSVDGQNFCKLCKVKTSVITIWASVWHTIKSVSTVIRGGGNTVCA